MLRGLTEQVRARRVSARALVERALARIEALDGDLNAVVALRAAEALAEADALDARLARGARVGPLVGLPLLAKEVHDVAGMPTTNASLVFADAPPAARDCLHIARLRAAGAIVVGKTNIPEFCFEGFTDNRLFGMTRNPWARDWSPGGSSGGSGVAVAAGMAPIATAGDGGGSIRIPAAFCGLAGLKPTHGAVGREDAPDWMDYTTNGPLGVSVDDVRLLFEAERGPAPGDVSSFPESALRPAPAGRRPSRVYAVPRFADWGPLPRPIADLFADALEVLEGDLGLPVEPVAPAAVLPDGNVDDDWFATASAEQAHKFGVAWIDANADRLHPAFLTAMRIGLSVTFDEYLAARRRRFVYARRIDELLGEDAVIVSPTMPSEGFYADGTMPGEDHPGTPSSAYNTQLQNVTGHPALTVPAGVSPNGVPFGLQITGPRFADELVLALGEALEQARPWPLAAPGYKPFDVA